MGPIACFSSEPEKPMEGFPWARLPQAGASNQLARYCFPACHSFQALMVAVFWAGAPLGS